MVQPGLANQQFCEAGPWQLWTAQCAVSSTPVLHICSDISQPADLQNAGRATLRVVVYQRTADFGLGHVQTALQ